MTIFKLPKSTEFGRIIPKNAFDSYTNSKQRKLISEGVSRIIWTHKLSPATTNLVSKRVKEIQLFLIELKGRNSLKKILEIIEKAIPYHIIFILQFENEIKLLTSAKHEHANKLNESVLDCLFETEWVDKNGNQTKINLSESLDLTFINFCSQILGRVSVIEDYEGFISREVEIRDLESRIRVIENQIKREKQFNKKVSLNLKLSGLNLKLKSCT